MLRAARPHTIARTDHYNADRIPRRRPHGAPAACHQARWVCQDPIGQAPEHEERFACAQPQRRVMAHPPCHRAFREKLQKTWRWLVGTAVAIGSLGKSITERAADVAAQDDEADIETQLRDYIRANPGAGDTAIGIVSFWLCMPPTPQNIATVERVLVRRSARRVGRQCGYCPRVPRIGRGAGLPAAPDRPRPAGPTRLPRCDPGAWSLPYLDRPTADTWDCGGSKTAAPMLLRSKRPLWNINGAYFLPPMTIWPQDRHCPTRPGPRRRCRAGRLHQM